jgi:hypothetical protein
VLPVLPAPPILRPAGGGGVVVVVGGAAARVLAAVDGENGRCATVAVHHL